MTKKSGEKGERLRSQKLRLHCSCAVQGERRVDNFEIEMVPPLRRRRSRLFPASYCRMNVTAVFYTICRKGAEAKAPKGTEYPENPDKDDTRANSSITLQGIPSYKRQDLHKHNVMELLWFVWECCPKARAQSKQARRVERREGRKQAGNFQVPTLSSFHSRKEGRM